MHLNGAPILLSFSMLTEPSQSDAGQNKFVTMEEFERILKQLHTETLRGPDDITSPGLLQMF